MRIVRMTFAVVSIVFAVLFVVCLFNNHAQIPGFSHLACAVKGKIYVQGEEAIRYNVPESCYKYATQ